MGRDGSTVAYMLGIDDMDGRSPGSYDMGPHGRGARVKHDARMRSYEECASYAVGRTAAGKAYGGAYTLAASDPWIPG